MAFPGSMPMGGMPGIGNDTAGMSDQEKQMVKYMQMGMESCAGKTVMSGVMGAGLGAMFGLFMSSMRYDTPYTPQGAAVAALPLKAQLRAGLKEMGRASYSSGKNFGKVGAIFSGTECVIEGFRAKNDLYNGVAAGCITGGALAAAAGPQAAAVGCAGFAVFSAAIDAYMRMPEDERSRPIA